MAKKKKNKRYLVREGKSEFVVYARDEEDALHKGGFGGGCEIREWPQSKDDNVFKPGELVDFGQEL